MGFCGNNNYYSMQEARDKRQETTKMDTHINLSNLYMNLSFDIPPPKSETENNQEEKEPKQQKQQKRCGHSECRKKLTLTDDMCKCGFRFCSTHRFADTHNCTFDYKSLKVNPVKCVADKVERI